MSDLLWAIVYSLPGVSLAYWFGYRHGKSVAPFHWQGGHND